MKAISVIEDQDVIKKFLQRLTNPQTPRIAGGVTPSATKSDPTNKDGRMSHRKFRVPALHLRQELVHGSEWT